MNNFDYLCSEYEPCAGRLRHKRLGVDSPIPLMTAYDVLTTAMAEVKRLRTQLAQSQLDASVLAALLHHATNWIDAKTPPEDGKLVATLTWATVQGESNYIHNMQSYIGGEWSAQWLDKEPPHYWFRFPKAPEGPKT